MAYFKHVQSNIKGGVDVELGEKTIIVGPNGSGKSAVQNSLELATRGFVTDLTGRDEVRKLSDLFTLGDGRELYVQVEMDDGVNFQWRTVKKGKTIKKPASDDVKQPISVAWPVLDVESMMKGNAETQRKWLLRMAGEATRASIHAHISEVDLYDSIAEQVSGNTEVEKLASVLEAVSSRRTRAQSRLTQAETTMEALSRGLGSEPRDSEIEDLRARLSELQNSAPESQVARVSQADVEASGARAQAAVNEWQATQQALAAATSERQGIDVPPTRDLIVQMGRTLRAIAPYNPSACMVCGTEVTRDWSALAGQWEGQAAQYAEADRLDAEVNRLTALAASQKQTALNLAEQFQSISARFNAQPEAPDTSLMSSIVEAQRALSEAEFAKSQWERVRDQQTIVKEARAEHRDLSNLKDDCRSALDDMVRGCVTRFEQAVQAHLPGTDTFRLVLGEKSVAMGFAQEDDVLHTALSGAEWARLTLAVAAAQLRLSKHEGPVVLTPKERAWDPTTLSAAMRALSDAPGQVLLLSPIKPKGRLPKGWTMVEVG
jgi:DNA repair exonuclease SbcCD ATPase subunit